MVNLLWILLNIILCWWILKIIYASIRLVYKEYGLGYAFVLFIALVSGCSEKNENHIKNQHIIWKTQDSMLNSTGFGTIELENNFASSNNIRYHYGYDSLAKKKRIHTVVNNLNGLTAFIFWKPQFLTINNSNNNNEYYYHLSGFKNWYLLNICVYTGPVEYNGKIILK